jgi:hypothetical protein
MSLLNKARAVRVALLESSTETLSDCAAIAERCHSSLAVFIDAECDAYAERIAIVLEAGDIDRADARRIAEADIGAAFVRTFLAGEVAP